MCWALFNQNEKADTIRRKPPINHVQSIILPNVLEGKHNNNNKNNTWHALQQHHPLHSTVVTVGSVR